MAAVKNELQTTFHTKIVVFTIKDSVNNVQSPVSAICVEVPFYRGVKWTYQIHFTYTISAHEILKMAQTLFGQICEPIARKTVIVVLIFFHI